VTTSTISSRSPQTQAAVGRQPLTEAIAAARDCLLSKQQPDGHWVGELQGDTILESEYILLMAFLGRERADKPVRAARYLLSQHMLDGGWNNYPGGPAELSTTVKGYFALKLTGHNPDAAYMRRARDLILSMGGAARCNSFTRFYLALLGQIPYSHCPTVPPEMLLLPRWFYFNIYAMSSWTRTIVVPLSIMCACRPVRQLPPEVGISELFLDNSNATDGMPKPPCRLLSWTNFFFAVDAALKKFGKYEPAWMRRYALKLAASWMRERFVDSDGLGAIFPPMIYTVIALRCLGTSDDAPEMQWALKQLDNLMIEEDGAIRLQPCFSPVWDTSLSLIGLADADDSPALASSSSSAADEAVDWLLAREVRRPGDWQKRLFGLPPAGWFFEYRNGFYPDTDDTAMVLMALARTGAAQDRARPAVDRALTWLLRMQNDDGGWGAFDRNINHKILEKVPFADHNAMLDPSCPDITARVLEALAHFGYSTEHPRVRSGIDFIRKSQDPRGCWLGRWGVNYIYGTWQVLQGLRKVRFDMHDVMVRRALAWLKETQQADGGWGETCRSYDDPSLAGMGTPTASQTAWALLGLLAAGQQKSHAVRRGIDYLIQTQQPNGNWQEEPFTGTGFPKVFYLKYHMYSLYFPLMALSRYAAALERNV
jgi:squalene-hopene/tetraprenyl-beta-curcumene cyclase